MNHPISLRRGLGRALGLAALLLVGPASSATGLSFSALAVSLGAGNTANQFVDTASPPVTRIRTSTAEVVSSNALSFQTRYALALGADVGNNGSINENHAARYTITFAVTQTTGVAWQVRLDTTRVGALTLVDDGAGSGSARLTALGSTRSGAGTLSGSLTLAAISNLTGASGGNTPFHQAASAVLSGLGTGAAQSVTLNFSFNARATSTRSGGNGDEAAVRMGLAGNATGFTAGNYPGIGGRTAAGDGHFVTATLVPEPGSALLTALGLTGIAGWRRRRIGGRAQ